jgi:ABC-type multidrug transport system ATPase subunit
MTLNHLIASELQMGYGAALWENPIQFSLAPATIYGITGPSGGGKSTFLKSLGGILKPLGGKAMMGSSATYLDDRLLTGNPKIAYLAQDFQLLEKHNALENLFHAAPGSNIHQQEKEAKEMLAFLGGTEWGSRRVDLLSGGQRQRVALGRSMMQKPNFLLLDEPTNQLDAHWRNEFFMLIRRIAIQKKMGVVLVSHNPAELLQVCDEIAVLTDRGLSPFQSAQNALKKPNSIEMAKYLGYFVEISQEWKQEFGVMEEHHSRVFARKNDFRLEQEPHGWILEHAFSRFDGCFGIVSKNGKHVELKIPTKLLNKIGSEFGVRLKSWIAFL